MRARGRSQHLSHCLYRNGFHLPPRPLGKEQFKPGDKMTSILCLWTLLYLAMRLQLKPRHSLSCARTQAPGSGLESKRTAPLPASSSLGCPKPLALALAVDPPASDQGRTGGKKRNLGSDTGGSLSFQRRFGASLSVGTLQGGVLRPAWPSSPRKATCSVRAGSWASRML